tara:strand:+ start:1116 stop:2573 length:1458 start_codon:yes stop_codon:yes gene_type:complete
MIKVSGDKIKYDKISLINSFLNHVKATPEKIALTYKNKKFSYSKLFSLIKILSKKILTRNTNVVVIMQRDVNLPIAVWALLLSQNTYIPLNNKISKNELLSILQKLNCNTIITNLDRIKKFKLKRKIKVLFLKKNSYNNDKKISNVNLKKIKKLKDLYIIHTSGTTGKPKGIRVSEISLLNRLQWMKNLLDLTKKDNFILKTPYTFDVSIWELYLPFFIGSTLNVLNDGAHLNQNELNETISKRNISVIHFVPTMLDIFQLYNFKMPLTMKNVICSGEKLSSATVNKFNKLNPDVKLYNFYGPAETTVDVTYYKCKKKQSSIPIGKICPNVNFVLKSTNSNPNVGELLISGIQLSNGYTDKKLNKEKFVFLKRKKFEKFYKTGDLCKYSNGNLYFLKRIDSQIKIYGERFEMDSISNFAITNKYIDFARCSFKNSKIFLYIKCRENIKKYDIIKFLKKKFENKFLPRKIVFLKKIPLNLSGKFDN